jgi:hypothetical protein
VHPLAGQGRGRPCSRACRSVSPTAATSGSQDTTRGIGLWSAATRSPAMSGAAMRPWPAAQQVSGRLDHRHPGAPRDGRTRRVRRRPRCRGGSRCSRDVGDGRCLAVGPIGNGLPSLALAVARRGDGERRNRPPGAEAVVIVGARFGWAGIRAGGGGSAGRARDDAVSRDLTGRRGGRGAPAGRSRRIVAVMTGPTPGNSVASTRGPVALAGRVARHRGEQRAGTGERRSP